MPDRAIYRMPEIFAKNMEKILLNGTIM